MSWGEPVEELQDEVRQLRRHVAELYLRIRGVTLEPRYKYPESALFLGTYGEADLHLMDGQTVDLVDGAQAHVRTLACVLPVCVLKVVVSTKVITCAIKLAPSVYQPEHDVWTEQAWTAFDDRPPGWVAEALRRFNPVADIVCKGI